MLFFFCFWPKLDLRATDYIHIQVVNPNIPP